MLNTPNAQNHSALKHTAHKNLFLALLIAMVLYTGVIYSVLPHGIRYYVLRAQGQTYAPMACYDVDILNTYAPRYRDVIDGKIIAGEIDTYEHKDEPTLWSLLSPIALAPFFIPFDTIFPGMIITDLVFPLLTFFSFFLLVNALTKNRFLALFFSFWLMVYAGIVLYIPPLNSMELKVLILRFFPFLVDKVPIGPKFRLREAFIPCAPFFILSLYFTYLTVSRETRTKVYGALAGVFYGLLFYLYFYFWVFFTVFLGLFFLILLAKRKTCEARMIFIIMVIGLIISIPFWVNQFKLTQLPQYNEIMDRVAGYEVGHAFRINLWMRYLTYITMAVLALWLGKKLNTPIKALFLVALALAGIVVLNIQVITGFNIQSDHWFSRVFIIVHNIIWAAIVYDLFLYFKPSIGPWVVRYKKILKILFFVAILYFSLGVLYNQVITEKRRAPLCTMPASLMRGYEWLNANTPTDSVVMTPSFITSAEIPVYTHNRIFLARSHNSLATDEEIFHRLYIAYKMLGISPADLYEMLGTFGGIFNLVNFKYFSRELDAYYGGNRIGFNIPAAEREKILSEYIFFTLPKEMPYRIDYIFIGPREKGMGVQENILYGADKLYDSLGTAIYQRKK